MIAVLCVMAAAAVLALTLLRSAVTASRFGKRDQKEQCRILAVSLAECLAAAVEQMEYEYAAAGENGEDEEAEDVVPAWIPQTEFLEHLERIAADGSELELRLEDDSGLPGTAAVTVWAENDEENPFPENAVLCMKVTVFLEEDSYTLASRFVFEETGVKDEDVIEIQDEESGEGEENESGDEWENEYWTGHWKYDGRITDAG